MSFWYVAKKNLPEDGVDKRRNATELQSDELAKKGCISCWVINSDGNVSHGSLCMFMHVYTLYI
jgi:hypothetical protein